MRVVAEFAMRGRREALIASVGAMAMPGLSFLGTAVVALVTLRRGWREGCFLLLWASLPAIGWLMAASEPVPILLLVGTSVLAMVLRITVSWPATLATTVLLSLPALWIFELVSAAVLDQIAKSLLEWSEKSGAAPLGAGGDAVWLRRFLLGMVVSGQLTVMLGTLILARWWQSLLYNPGGFGQEFRQLRLPPGLTLGLLALMLMCHLSGSAYLSSWLFILVLPIVFHGIALLHWFAKARQLGPGPLAGFYLLLMFVPQFVLPALMLAALADSLLGLRGRMKLKSD